MLVALFALSALATDAEMYFSSDSNGANRVTMIQEGDEVWIAVYDPDENIDCNLRDKIWTDIKIMDPKTGAYINWHKGSDGDATSDYLEETDADTGLFVSKRAFQVGTRVVYSATGNQHTHIVGPYTGTTFVNPTDFVWGNYIYTDAILTDNLNTDQATLYGDDRVWVTQLGQFTSALTTPVPTGEAWLPPPSANRGTDGDYLLGRFENNDTIVGMYKDPNDSTDVAVTMGKIIDTEAVISWDQEVYPDALSAATITVVDPDENLNCNQVEAVPVFVLVNPGSWNVQTTSLINNFCQLKRTGGVRDNTGAVAAVTTVPSVAIRWFNIYHSGLTGTTMLDSTSTQDRAIDGGYYIKYPATFDVKDTNHIVRVSFYAWETSANSGVFKVKLNSILDDLGFTELDVRDVLVAYYLDPNDFDDFKLATSYIEERQHSLTSFTNANRGDMAEYWIGRDPVYVQVIDQNANVDPCCPEQVVVHICDPHGEDDSEWYILDETSSNSPVFLTMAGMQLLPVWDALGIGLANSNGGYQLVLDNWKLEVFNEDSVYARYNDVYYTDTAMRELGDTRLNTSFPPAIRDVRVANDVSFDLMEIVSTEVFDGTNTQMFFLDRQGNRVSGYVNSDCVFVEVVDIDQDEDQYRREQIASYWDGPADTTLGGGTTYAGQNVPFGPEADAYLECDTVTPYDGTVQSHSVNALLGTVDVYKTGEEGGWPKLYVLNPHNGYWAAIDLMENGVATGDFVSVTCIDLASQYVCLPTLDVKPGDTIVAVYQDPSNHSDSSWISIKVGIGGGGTPPGQASTTKFSDAEGNVVTTYTDADDVYVKVIDPSHAGADTLTGLEVEGIAYDLSYLEGANTDTFITDAIPMADLGAVAGDEITANYTDATDPLDTSTDTVPIISSELVFESFIAKPNPFSDEVTFTFEGAGIPETFAVTVYNMSGHLVWSEELSNATEIVWDGQNEAGMPLANGPYIYVAMITDGTDTYTGKGKVFINK